MNITPNNDIYGKQNNKIGCTIGTIIGWFKTMTTNAYIDGVQNKNWEPFNGKLWQRNYFEHIIKNGEAYNQIAHYIKNNPFSWNEDILK